MEWKWFFVFMFLYNIVLQGRRNTFYASIAKSFASDVANKNATDCVQVWSSRNIYVGVFI